MRSILVIQLKRIGDLILTLPALKALRSAHPAAKITLVIDGASAGLLPLIGSVDRVLVYRKGSMNLAVFCRLIFGRFDAAIDFTGTDRSLLLTGLSRARRRVAFRWAADLKFRAATYTDFVDSPVREKHTMDHYLDLLSGIGINHADANLALKLPDSATEKARVELQQRQITGQYLVFHVGAARAEKYWKSEGWAAVLNHCQQKLGLPCLLIGGDSPMEREAIAEIVAAVHPAVHDLSGQLSLPVSASLIERAALFVGIDSGPSHLAAALQVPQITLFGPTNPFHWRARHSRALVLQGGKENPVAVFEPQSKAGDLNALSTAEVIHAINLLLLPRACAFSNHVQRSDQDPES